MLRFFRQIRQSLLTDNKFSKYLLYAVGEILLVVIGILIALQVDNWNERNQLKRTQQEQLTKLKLDLKYDLSKMKELDSLYLLWDKQVQYILDKVLYAKIDKLDSIEQYWVGTGSLFYITQKRTTYDEMLSTGSFYKLQNDSLSNMISEFYEISSFELTKLNLDNQALAEYAANPIHDERQSITNRLAFQKNLEHIDWSWLNNPDSKLYKELEVRVTWFRVAIEANRSVMQVLSEKAKSLISTIDREFGIE